MATRSPFMITPSECESLVGQPSVKFIDASWYLPAQSRDPIAEFNEARIPGAVFFDLDLIADQQTDLPHMLPTAEEFQRAVSALGISNDDQIVVYDGPGLFSCARVWWMFRIMGAENVRILEGGFDDWRSKGRPVETGNPVNPNPGIFTASFKRDRVWDVNQIRANLKSGEALILDARSFDRFAGRTPEPRPGLQSGHIPGSRSLPFNELVENGRLKDIETLRSIFEKLSISSDRKVVTSCGSGVTAAVISLALASIGHDNSFLYDGSWAEWGQADNAPVAQWPDGEN